MAQILGFKYAGENRLTAEEMMKLNKEREKRNGNLFAF